MPERRIHNPTVIPAPQYRHTGPLYRHSGESRNLSHRADSVLFQSHASTTQPSYQPPLRPLYHHSPPTVIPAQAGIQPHRIDSAFHRRNAGPYQSFSLITENTAPSLSRSTANRAKSAMSIGATTTPPPSSCALATVASKSATPK